MEGFQPEDWSGTSKDAAEEAPGCDLTLKLSWSQSNQALGAPSPLGTPKGLASPSPRDSGSWKVTGVCGRKVGREAEGRKANLVGLAGGGGGQSSELLRR